MIITKVIDYNCNNYTRIITNNVNSIKKTHFLIIMLYIVDQI